MTTDSTISRATLAAEAKECYEAAANEYRENLGPERDPDEIPQHLVILYANWQSLEADPVNDATT